MSPVSKSRARSDPGPHSRPFFLPLGWSGGGRFRLGSACVHRRWEPPFGLGRGGKGNPSSALCRACRSVAGRREATWDIAVTTLSRRWAGPSVPHRTMAMALLGPSLPRRTVQAHSARGPPHRHRSRTDEDRQGPGRAQQTTVVVQRPLGESTRFQAPWYESVARRHLRDSEEVASAASALRCDRDRIAD